MKKHIIFFIVLLAGLSLLICSYLELKNDMASLSGQVDGQKHLFDVVNKKSEDLHWYHILADVAYVDKVRLTGPPHHNPAKTNNPFHDRLLDNDLVFYAYVFIPKSIDINKKYPLIVFVHGGVHGTFSIVYSHVVKELIAQGYIIVAPDYRGSIGYGRKFWESIDYGGRENGDVLASRNYIVDNYAIVDSTHIGLLGWSHGGMITLMNLLYHPDKYACGYAGVPVSDVTYRLEYQKPEYKDLFSANYHIGKTIAEDPEEYKRRSPVSYAKNLSKPLMITTVENDDDVGVFEVQRMIDSLKFYKKDFEYKVYGALSGAHLFERIDIKEATDIRFNVYKFLEKYLEPPIVFNSVSDMRKAGYGFNGYITY
jgi:dipeptidyl aminopeptidase/acylaminoacyl peptidase